jgi:hypothetical protein
MIKGQLGAKYLLEENIVKIKALFNNLSNLW